MKNILLSLIGIIIFQGLVFSCQGTPSSPKALEKMNGKNLELDGDALLNFPRILPIFGEDGVGRLSFFRNGQWVPLSENMVITLADDLIAKAKAIACNRRISPSSISVSAIGFLYLTWERDDLCSH